MFSESKPKVSDRTPYPLVEGVTGKAKCVRPFSDSKWISPDIDMNAYDKGRWIQSNFDEMKKKCVGEIKKQQANSPNRYTWLHDVVTTLVILFKVQVSSPTNIAQSIFLYIVLISIALQWRAMLNRQVMAALIRCLIQRKIQLMRQACLWRLRLSRMKSSGQSTSMSHILNASLPVLKPVP
jgi:hypothetical protein